MVKSIVTVALVASAFAVQAFEARQMFRKERFSRDNVNLLVLQPADEASWTGRVSLIPRR